MTLRALMAVAFVAGCVSAQGCTAVNYAQRLPTDPVARYVPPKVAIPAPAVGDCADVVELGPGESRPCASVSVPAGYLVALRTAVEQARTITEPALSACYDGRDADRADVAALLEDISTDQRVIRERAFAAGCAVCGGACASTVGAVGAATR